MDWTRGIAERAIKEAIDAGEFDNLPGKGKPLNLDEDAGVPAHQRVGLRIMRNAGALPEWLQAGKDIHRETDAAAHIREQGLKRIAYAAGDDARGRAAARLRADLRERMELVNTLILKYNMTAPSGYQRSFTPFRIADELKGLESEIAAIGAGAKRS